MNLVCDQKREEIWGVLERKRRYYDEFQLPLPHGPDDFWLRPQPVVVSTDLLDKEIEASRQILGLEDNWDGEGAVRISKETWNKAVTFLNNHRIAWDLERNVPTISPVNDGSVDLHWKSERFEVLINIKEHSDQAGIYADDYRTAQIRKRLDLTRRYPNLLDFLISSY